MATFSTSTIIIILHAKQIMKKDPKQKLNNCKNVQLVRYLNPFVSITSSSSELDPKEVLLKRFPSLS